MDERETLQYLELRRRLRTAYLVENEPNAGLMKEVHDFLLLQKNALEAARRTTPDREAWQPIETAPRDGTPLVMFARYIHATASIVVVAAWLETYGMWVNQSFSGGPIQQVVPSHWMPRPEFPTSDKGGA